MKAFFKTATMLVLTIMLFASVNSASAASISSTRFSLYRWDGPMYIDFSASCSQLAAMDVLGDGGRLDQQRGALNGTWRIWTSLKPRTTYTIDLICQDTSGRGTVWEYKVYFSGGSMNVSRIRTFGW